MEFGIPRLRRDARGEGCRVYLLYMFMSAHARHEGEEKKGGRPTELDIKLMKGYPWLGLETLLRSTVQLAVRSFPWPFDAYILRSIQFIHLRGQ